MCLLSRRLRDGRNEDKAKAVPRVLVVHPQNGLGNRLRALASAMEFAYMTRRVLVVVWARDPHLDATMHVLFDESVMAKLVVIHDELPWPVVPTTDLTAPESRDGSFVYYNRMEKDTTRVNPSPVIADVPEMHIYVKTAYVFDHSASAPDVYANVLIQSLRPAPAVLSRVDSFERRIGALKRKIGVHMRSRSIKDDNSAVDPSCEYTARGIAVTDHWRAMSAPDKFAPVMLKQRESAFPTRLHRLERAEEIEEWRARSAFSFFLPSYWAPRDPAHDWQPDFFVSADTEASIAESKTLCNCTVESLPQLCRDRDSACIISAFADILALSRCGALLLSGWSSFSEAAMRLRVRDYEEMNMRDGEGFTTLYSGTDFGVVSWKEHIAGYLGISAGNESESIDSTAKRRTCAEQQHRKLSLEAQRSRHDLHQQASTGGAVPMAPLPVSRISSRVSASGRYPKPSGAAFDSSASRSISNAPLTLDDKVKPDSITEVSSTAILTDDSLLASESPIFDNDE
jgi:hypothetical protein